MISEYEVENVYLARFYSKARKLDALNSIKDLDSTTRATIEKKILGDETKEEVVKRAEQDEEDHWVKYYGYAAAADLLTLGKVQPETFLAMMHLPGNGFKQAVQIATKEAKKADLATMEAEQELKVNTIPKEMI